MARRGRRLAAAIGCGAHSFHRVLWLQQAPMLTGCSPRPGASLAVPGAAAGCADQVHMTRDLRADRASWTALLSGARSTLKLSDLFRTEAAPAGYKIGRNAGHPGRC